MIGTNRFTSGVTGCNHYIISMEDYKERDISTAWSLTKGYHGLDDNAEIDLNEYEEKYITVKWKGNVFYPTLHEEKVRGSKLVRIFKIKNNEKNVLESEGNHAERID